MQLILISRPMQLLFLKQFASSSTMLLSTFVFLLFGTTQAVIKLPDNETIQAIIAFGDSIADTGNNNYINTIAKCNYPPYGRDFLGGVPTGRFCNGKVPSDLIVEELGIKELLPAYLDPFLQTMDLLTGVNFASGGAGYDPLTSELGSVISLMDQLEMFKEYQGKLKGLVGEERTSTILTNSLFLVIAGSNDIANTYFDTPLRSLHYDVPSYTDLMVTSASTFLQELYGMGARRIGVFSAPPIGCVPSQRTLAGGIHRNCAENYNQAAQLFNTKLSAELDSLNSNLPHARMVYIDVYNPLFDLIQNPEKYGFEIANKGCCGTGTIEVAFLCNQFNPFTCTNVSRYIFWDSYHPTEKAYKVLLHQLLPKYIKSFF